VEYVKWSGNVDSFNRMACDPRLSDRGSATCASLYNDAGSEKTLMYAGFGVAGVLAATSVVLFLVLDPQGTAPNHQVACIPVGGSRGISCAVRF
jgi:hypothetical protein